MGHLQPLKGEGFVWTDRELQGIVLRSKPGAEQTHDRLPFMLKRKIGKLHTHWALC